METSAGCRLNGSGSGMITVEDLESFTDDQDLDSACHSHGSLEVDTEPMEDEQGRLLHYWQDIGRVHQVDVPTGKGTRKGSRDHRGRGKAPQSTARWLQKVHKTG